ncbi:MAG: hypothetical protein M1819_006999 [Sarea resinae]|nr:MAG: hypothetical protein M1819_006999 [Sarea resinae]
MAGMDIGQPPRYVSIEEALARSNEDLSIMGVVVDSLPIGATRGSDLQCTFTIADESDYNGLRCKFFRPKESQLPPIRGTGDVVILRRIQVKLWSGTKLALSNRLSEWIVFPASSIPEKVPEKFERPDYLCITPTRPPSAAEYEYAIKLCNSQDRSSFTAPAVTQSTTPSEPGSVIRQVVTPFLPKEKFSLIKDVADHGFYDLVGQVVKIYPRNFGDVEIYITDYTAHPLLYQYSWAGEQSDSTPREGDEYGYIRRPSQNKDWSGPYGRMTLKVELTHSHAEIARSTVSVDDFVLFRNVRIKYNQANALEGTMWDNGKTRDRIDVLVLKKGDARVEKVLQRKEEYLERHRKQKARYLKLAEKERKRNRKEDSCDSAEDSKGEASEEREKNNSGGEMDHHEEQPKLLPKSRKRKRSKKYTAQKEPAKKAEPIQEIKPAKKAEDAKETKHTNRVESTEEAEPSRETKLTRHVEPSRKTEPKIKDESLQIEKRDLNKQGKTRTSYLQDHRWLTHFQ